MTDRRDKSGPWVEGEKYLPKGDAWAIMEGNLNIAQICKSREVAVHDVTWLIYRLMNT